MLIVEPNIDYNELFLFELEKEVNPGLSASEFLKRRGTKDKVLSRGYKIYNPLSKLIELKYI